MDDELELIIDNGILSLRNKIDGKILAQHKPLGTAFNEFKRVKVDCNIIKEDEKGFPEDSKHNRANIYCLDDNFKIKWIITLPWDGYESFPGKICWNSETTWDKTGLISKENPNTFTSSSWKCFTVTVDYETGKTLKSEFTK